MRNNLKKGIILTITIILILTVALLGYKLYKNNNEMELASENLYNHALYELVDYMENVENYLAKATISTGSKHAVETLTSLWREANLAQTYLSMLPMESQELENTEKFLNQVSDYSYSLSRKNINGEELNSDDLKNLEQLYEYSRELSNVVNQISNDLNVGNIKWNDLTGNKNTYFAQQVSADFNLADSLEENFHEYEGLIYDGAYSEHITSNEKKGLTGEDISEEQAIDIVKKFVGEDSITEINSQGISENAATPVYTYVLKNNKDESITVTISKKGGHIVYMNTNRNVEEEALTEQEAVEKGKEFLNNHGFKSMKETYYFKENGVITINFAYIENGVTFYPDLIKLKIALDNGEILGIETKGYLNNHTQRDTSNVKITIDEARKKLNKNLNIESEGMAMIPTEWESEVLCYEFKGKVNDIEYLVYINAQTGEEEDVLIIVRTDNGTLTI